MEGSCIKTSNSKENVENSNNKIVDVEMKTTESNLDYYGYEEINFTKQPNILSQIRDMSLPIYQRLQENPRESVNITITAPADKEDGNVKECR